MYIFTIYISDMVDSRLHGATYHKFHRSKLHLSPALKARKCSLSAFYARSQETKRCSITEVGRDSWMKNEQIMCIYMGVSKNKGSPKSSILIGFSIIFTIHFGGPPLFLETPIY